jgi:hypothetical protein
MNDDVG